MPYTADKPTNAFDSETLRATIPGWGVDLDPAVRPAVPMEQFVPRSAAGTNGSNFPERQVALVPREKSTEHGMLPPVFGTTCPPKGLSGIIRRLSYARYSEGQSAHWLLLILADRIDVMESIVTSALRLRPDNPIAEMGLKAELTHHPIASRLGQHRTDVKHQPIDVLLALGKAALLGGAVYGAYKLVAKRSSRRRRLAFL